MKALLLLIACCMPPLAGCAPAVVDRWEVDVERTLQEVTEVPEGERAEFKDLAAFRQEVGAWLARLILDFEDWHDIPEVIRERPDRRFEGYFLIRRYYGHKSYVGGWREDDRGRFRIYQWSGTNVYLPDGAIEVAGRNTAWHRPAGTYGLGRIYLRKR